MSGTATDGIVVYKDIPDAPGYRVGDDGSVWSCRRTNSKRAFDWRILSQSPLSKCTQAYVTIRFSGRTRQIKVGELILGVFVGPRPPMHEVAFLDGNPRNLRLSNLKWASCLDVRYWPRIKETPNGCHEWQGAKSNFGYGRVVYDGEVVSTHRLAYQLAYGPVPEGLFILHQCDNPPCCRPDHLFLGTGYDNVQDMKKKGRMRHGVAPIEMRRGEMSSKAKLTNAKVVEMRKRYAIGGITLKEISSEFGISQATASLAINRKTWGHVG